MRTPFSLVAAQVPPSLHTCGSIMALGLIGVAAAACLVFGQLGARSSAPTGAFRCSPLVHAQSPLGLELFAGEYTLTQAAAQDSSDARELGGFENITIPPLVGYSGSNVYASLPHGNFAAGDAAQIHVGWSSPTFGGPVGSQMESDLRHADNAGWCVATTPGQFVLRAGVQQDLRWESKDALSVVWCEARPTWLGGGPTCARQYVGRPVYATLVADTGFPVQQYSVIDPRRAGNTGYVASVTADAQAQANALYLERRTDRPMAFSTFEMRLVGVIAQQGGSYARSLVGEMRRRTYNDPRLGLIDTVGGTEWRMSVVLTAAPLPAGAAPQVAQFCGTIAGCGTVDSALAVGGLIVRGSDDSVRFDAMCANMTGTAHCIDSTNPYLPTMDADSARVRAVLTSAGATGPPPTDSERTTSYDGARGPDAAGGAPAQWGRYCERAARDDSIARANAPVPLGTTPPVVTLDSTRLAACHAGNTNAFLPLTSGP